MIPRTAGAASSMDSMEDAGITGSPLFVCSFPSVQDNGIIKKKRGSVNGGRLQPAIQLTAGRLTDMIGPKSRTKAKTPE